MALLKVRTFPDPILKLKAEPLTTFTDKEQRLFDDMIETMYVEDGVGIAAPQVGISKQIIVVSPNAKRGEERIYINPEIIEFSAEKETDTEGCLSLPGISCEISRSTKIKFCFWDLNGRERLEELQHFPARVIQHEVDHLNGILLIDRVDFNHRQTLIGAYRRL